MKRFIFAGLLASPIAVLGDVVVEPFTAKSLESYSHFSREEPLSNLLRELVASQDVRVVVSKDIEDIVTGQFVGSSKKDLFENLIQAYDLDWFYDGNTVYIEKSSAREEKKIHLRNTPLALFKKKAEGMGLFQSKYRWLEVKEASVVFVSGPKTYVEKLENLADSMEESGNYGSVYMWKDSKGQTHFSNVPHEVPYEAEVKVMDKQEKKNRFALN